MITNTNAALIQAERLLRRDAESLRECHTSHQDRDDWTGEDDAKAGYDEYIRAADALAALTTAAAVPPEGVVMVPVELAERVQESLGEFLMDHGWSQRDMDTSDDFGAVLLAAAPKAEPVPETGFSVSQPAGEYPPLPTGSAWCGDDDVRDFGTGPGESALMFAPTRTQQVPLFTADQMRAYVDADRAMRAQAAPAAVASPLTKLQRKAIAVCFTSDKVSVSEVQRKLSISYADAQTLCQSIVDLGLTDELELAPSLKRGAPAPHPAPVAQGDARAEEALLKVLSAVQRYLPPDGPSAKDTLTEIIGIVDPWPLDGPKGNV